MKQEAMEQVVKLLQGIIAAIAEAPEDDGTILFGKMDIKYGLCQMICQAGAECNFSYVLPGESKEGKILVVPISIQMGLKLSPTYLCIDTETARYLVEKYINTLVGTLPPHLL